MAQFASQCLYHLRLFLARALHKARNLLKRNTLLLGERLHRIEHTIMARHALEHIHWHRASRMQEEFFLLARTKLWNQQRQSIILDREDIHIGIAAHLGNIGYGSPSGNRGKRLSRLLGSAIYL